MGEQFAEIARGGPLLLAVGVAVLAGLVSFASPCVLPLVPGYLSYVTGLAGADLDAVLGRQETRADLPVCSVGAGGAVTLSRSVPASRVGGPRTHNRRVLAGTVLFIAGFTAVFTVTGVLAAELGRALLAHARVVELVVGLLIVVLGLAFLGLVPGLQREWRLHRLPSAGLAGAPVFGAVFALGWVPCVGPTLGAVLGLAAVGGQTDRAVILAVAYCLGLGLPFVAFGLGFRRLIGVFTALRRNGQWVTRVGGALLVLVGLALVTGGWTDFVNWLRSTVGVGSVSI